VGSPASFVTRRACSKAYEPQIRARLGTAAHFSEGVVLKLRTVPIGTGASNSVYWARPMYINASVEIDADARGHRQAPRGVEPVRSWNGDGGQWLQGWTGVRRSGAAP